MSKSIVVAFLFLGTFLSSKVLPLEAAVTNWQKGASIQPKSSTDFGSDSMKQSLADLKAQGANYVSFVIPYYQSDIHSTDIGPGWNTPTDSALIAGIDYAHSIGLSVSLKIHLESNDGQWRAYINPPDRNTWFANYKNVLMRYAQIGAAHDVEQMVIGTELISMSTATSNGDNTAKWEDMIAQVRSVYHGKLTYGANWGGFYFAEEAAHINFWDSLDDIGLSAYYPLSSNGSNDVDSLKASWDAWNKNTIAPLSARWGKPVIFTEVGYRSVTDAHTDPWNAGRVGTYDAQEQVNDYTALFSYWNDYEYMRGIAMWDWSSDPHAGRQGDTGYTPQNKPAEEVIKTWFQGINTPPPSTTATPTFDVTATPTTQTTQLNDEAPIVVTVKNGAAPASNLIVDIEVFAPNGQRVHQTFFQGQNFTGNESKSYQISQFIDTYTGTYTIKAGIFNATWSHNYAWFDKLAEIIATSSSPSQPPTGSTTPPASSSINVWWPTDNANLAGIQPFKAMVPDREVASYKMFWQVDGGQLNLMQDIATDYPHKEAVVDLSGWNWKAAGSAYTITFVAQELNGTPISTRTVPVYIR